MGSRVSGSKNDMPVVVKVCTLYIEIKDTFTAHQREEVLPPAAWKLLFSRGNDGVDDMLRPVGGAAADAADQ